MVRNRKTFGLGDCCLTLFDFCVVKLFYLAAVQANQVIVVFALVKLKYGLATFKVAACQDASLFELREPVVRGLGQRGHRSLRLRVHFALAHNPTRSP